MTFDPLRINHEDVVRAMRASHALLDAQDQIAYLKRDTELADNLAAAAQAAYEEKGTELSESQAHAQRLETQVAELQQQLAEVQFQLDTASIEKMAQTALTEIASGPPSAAAQITELTASLAMIQRKLGVAEHQARTSRGEARGYRDGLVRANKRIVELEENNDFLLAQVEQRDAKRRRGPHGARALRAELNTPWQ